MDRDTVRRSPISRSSRLDAEDEKTCRAVPLKICGPARLAVSDTSLELGGAPTSAHVAKRPFRHHERRGAREEAGRRRCKGPVQDHADLRPQIALPSVSCRRAAPRRCRCRAAPTNCCRGRRRARRRRPRRAAPRAGSKCPRVRRSRRSSNTLPRRCVADPPSAAAAANSHALSPTPRPPAARSSNRTRRRAQSSQTVRRRRPTARVSGAPPLSPRRLHRRRRSRDQPGADSGPGVHEARRRPAADPARPGGIFS